MNSSEIPNGSPADEDRAYLRYRPDLTAELIIPTDAPRRHRWWAGGQSLRETLLELHADEATLHAYDVGAGLEHLGIDWIHEEEES